MLYRMEFDNPDKKPLSELVFHVKEDGVQLKFPALHGRWVNPRCYTMYKGLTIIDGKVPNNATTDEWLSETEWFNKDVEYLLCLEHFRFWSHLVYEKKCIELIISFLQEATPFYTPLTSVTDNENIIELYTKVLSNVLRVICRMVTSKESETEWITKDHLKDLLYSKFLMSIPMIFDLIIAYGRDNKNILTKIVQTIFKVEPKYNNDLKIGLHFLHKTLTVIQNRTIMEGQGEQGEPISSFEDLAIYCLDCASTLSLFLEIYPEARSICCEIQLDQRISNFYDNTIPMLYKNLYTINTESPSLTIVNRARVELLNAFRSITYLHIENILKNPGDSILPAENFVAILTECLADRTFVIDYQKFYPVEVDIDILKQACKDLDSFKADFVLKGYTSESEAFLTEMMLKEEQEILDEREQEYLEGASNAVILQPESNSIDVQPQRDIDTEVTTVLDILPHLGDGFIRRLLVRYDNAEGAIAAMLEGNLPPDLAEADQNEVYIPPDPKDAVYRETGVRRNNIFDGDEYDIMTQDNPKGLIKTKKGFPGKPKNIKDLLDDKSHVKEMRARYQEYSLIAENDEYDDEYDDSYDALAESESKKTKSSAFKHVLEVEEDESEESSEEEVAEENTKSDDRRNFCENPEVIRARYEQKRNAKYGNRPSRDVVGKPKGQGQDDKVVINRHKKEANKSSRANHNRKSGASWKRTRGMIPS